MLHNVGRISERIVAHLLPIKQFPQRYAPSFSLGTSFTFLATACRQHRRQNHMLPVSPLAYPLLRRQNHMLPVSPPLYPLLRRLSRMPLLDLSPASSSIQINLRVPYLPPKNSMSDSFPVRTLILRHPHHEKKYAQIYY